MKNVKVAFQITPESKKPPNSGNLVCHLIEVEDDENSDIWIYVDIMSVIHNTSKSESTLKKKCNLIAYHSIHESVAMGE